MRELKHILGRLCFIAAVISLITAILALPSCVLSSFLGFPTSWPAVVIFVVIGFFLWWLGMVLRR